MLCTTSAECGRLAAAMPRIACFLILLVVPLVAGCGGSKPPSNSDFPDTSDPAAASDLLYGDLKNARNTN